MIGHAEEVYEGMVIGIHSRDNGVKYGSYNSEQVSGVNSKTCL